MYHTENKHGLPYQLDKVEADNSKHKLVSGDTEVEDNDSAQQTVSAIGSSDAENDAPKKMSGIYNDKQIVRGTDQPEEEEPAETNIHVSQTNGNNADVQIYVKKMPNEENSNGVDKKIDIEERDTVSKVTIPYKNGEKDAELKPRKEFTGILELSRITRDKCEISPVHESTLELQNNTDENTANRDMIIVAPRMDQKHANYSELTTPDSSESKEELLPKCPETGFENSGANWCKLLPQIVAVTDSEMTSTLLSESSLPKGSGMNKHVI